MPGWQRVDEQPRVSDLVTAASPEEPAQLRRYRPLSLCRLALEDPERGELALSRDDVEHGVGPKAADEFILQVGVTDVEPELGQRTGPDTCPGERTRDATRLPCITQAEQPVARAARAVAVEEVNDAGRASHRHDRHPLGYQIMANATGQRLDRHPVTLALDQHRRRLHRTSLANASCGSRAVSGRSGTVRRG